MAPAVHQSTVTIKFGFLHQEVLVIGGVEPPGSEAGIFGNSESLKKVTAKRHRRHRSVCVTAMTRLAKL